MTTIVWDGITLAADSQANCSDAVCSLSEQKIFSPSVNERCSVNDEPVLAFDYKGNCGAEAELSEVLRQGLKFYTLFTPAPSFLVLAITGKNRVWIISKEKGDE